MQCSKNCLGKFKLLYMALPNNFTTELSTTILKTVDFN